MGIEVNSAGSVDEALTRAAQVLLIDADDTLWENNLHYERALAEFERLLAPLGLSRELIRLEVNRTEALHIPLRGYGARHFVNSLVEVYRKLAADRAEEKIAQQILCLTSLLLPPDIRIYAEVPETLAYLARRHRLYLLTKGDREEQSGKVERSGLKQFFEVCEVLPEKGVEEYRGLVARHQLPIRSTWMVGNSPRSDINPALVVGLNAVFIPSRHNWEWEQEEIRVPEGSAGTGRLLVLERFADLRQHF